MIHFEKARDLMLVFRQVDNLDNPRLRDIEAVAQDFGLQLMDCLQASAPNELVAQVSQALHWEQDTQREEQFLAQLSDYEAARFLTEGLTSTERDQRALNHHYKAWLSGEYTQLEAACIAGVNAGHKALGYYFRANLFDVLRRNEIYGQEELGLPRYYHLPMLTQTAHENYKGALQLGMEEARQPFIRELLQNLHWGNFETLVQEFRRLVQAEKYQQAQGLTEALFDTPWYRREHLKNPAIQDRLEPDLGLLHKRQRA